MAVRTRPLDNCPYRGRQRLSLTDSDVPAVGRDEDDNVVVGTVEGIWVISRRP
jgi:hypothetical protein